MTRMVCGSRELLSVCLALSVVGSAGAERLSLGGAVIQDDAPAAYRLPAVAPTAMPDAPSDEPRVAVAQLFVSPPPLVVEQRTTTPPPAEVEVSQIAPQVVAQPAVEPGGSALSQQLLPAVRRGYDLAQRGALFAARTEFVQVLRRVAQARDAVSGSDQRAMALAAGLRALDEAEDFVPGGVQLEAELDVRAAASSHRTPVLREREDRVLPHEATALYHDYAQEQLTMAAAGEQAASMALYGLGRILAELAKRRDDDVRYVRSAMTMYAAALSACPNNHLAANELGVLVCRTGHPAAAVKLFERTIDYAPSATAYHNLAVAQQKLGLHAQAQANEQHAQRLAAWERSAGALSRRAGVEWVAPEDLARVAQPAELTPTAMPASAAPPQEKSTWQRTLELTKSLPRPGSAPANEGVGPQSGVHLARPAPPINTRSF